MTREQFAHVVRAAGAVLGTTEVLVIGSQALHGSMADPLPPEAGRSIEADVAALPDPDGRLADLIDGTIGEGSMFQETFGYYAHGVAERTAILPSGWHDRLIAFSTPSTRGVTAWCLEVHDLWLSKAVAGRPKDLEFCVALLRDTIVDRATLRDRLMRMPDLPDAIRAVIAARIG